VPRAQWRTWVLSCTSWVTVTEYMPGADSSSCVSRQVELDKGARQNGLKETEGGHDTDMGAHGATNQASPMRHRLRSSGAMEGQVRFRAGPG